MSQAGHKPAVEGSKQSVFSALGTRTCSHERSKSTCPNGTILGQLYDEHLPFLSGSSG